MQKLTNPWVILHSEREPSLWEVIIFTLTHKSLIIFFFFFYKKVYLGTTYEIRLGCFKKNLSKLTCEDDINY